jgi:ketosteroid isomerase-like protein
MPLSPSADGDRAAVAAAAADLGRLMLAPDRTGFDALLHERATWGHSDGRVQPAGEQVEALLEGRSVFETIETVDESIVIDGDTAILRQRFDATAVSRGRPVRPHLVVVLIWLRRDDRWRLLLRQAMPAPTA